MSKEFVLTDSERELVADNVRLVGYCIRKSFPAKCKRLENEDMYQIGCIGLMRAAHSFHSDRGAFSSFAYKCIKNEIMQNLRTLERKKNAPETDMLSLDKDYSETDAGLTLANLIVDIETVESMNAADEIIELVNEMDETARTVFAYRRLGWNNYQIADEIGLTRQGVGVVRNRIWKQYNKKLY